jgi:hypothetical protein
MLHECIVSLSYDFLHQLHLSFRTDVLCPCCISHCIEGICACCTCLMSLMRLFFGTNCIFDSCMLDNAPPIRSWERLSYSEYIARSPLLGPFCQGQEIKQMQRQIPRAKVDVLSRPILMSFERTRVSLFWRIGVSARATEMRASTQLT